MRLRRFRRTSRKSDSDDQVSLRELICAYWRRLRLLPLFRKPLRSQASSAPGSLSSRSNSITPSDPELGKLASLPDPTHITPFVGTQSSESTLLRSSTETSKRSSLSAITTTTTTSGCPRLQPLRRSLTTNGDLLASILSETNFFAGVEPGYGYTSYVYNKEDLALPPPSTPTHTDFERPSIDLIDIGIVDSPISLQARESPTVGEDQDPLPSPGRYRTPTYGTMFSQYSITTLPVYREQEDDRASVASRAPTYRSHRSMRMPRISLSRSSRPPLPVPPTLPIPLLSPSSPYPAKL